MEENKPETMWEATQWFILENYTRAERQWWCGLFRSGGLNPEILDRADEMVRQRERVKARQPEGKPEPRKVCKPLSCKRCNSTWTPRSKEPPVQCPRCHSPYWNRERAKK